MNNGGCFLTHRYSLLLINYSLFSFLLLFPPAGFFAEIRSREIIFVLEELLPVIFAFRFACYFVFGLFSAQLRLFDLFYTLLSALITLSFVFRSYFHYNFPSVVSRLIQCFTSKNEKFCIKSMRPTSIRSFFKLRLISSIT